MNNKKSLIIGLVVVSLFSVVMLPQVVVAENNLQENSQESVKMSVGQSLNVVIDSTFSDVEQKISEISRNRQLGQVSNPQERARVIAEDLNKTDQDAHNVREQYESTVEDYKSENISQREFIVEISKMTNNANRVDSNLKNIEYATQFMNESDLSQEGVTNKKIDEIRNEVGVIGGEVADNIRRKSVGGSKVSVNANQKAIEATISEDNGSIYEGRNTEYESYKNFNITADEAIDIFEQEFDVNTTNYNIKVEKDDDYNGYYKVEAENSTIEYEAVIDGDNGNIVEFERESSDNKNRKEIGESNKSDRGDIASNSQGPPPWAQNNEDEDDREDDNVEDDEEEEKDTDNEKNEYDYNITADEAKSIALDSISDNDWNMTESEKDDRVYEFEFVSEINTSVKTAEVTVDAKSGMVVEKEVEDERRENNNENEDEEDDREDKNDTVQIPVQGN